MAVEDDQYIPTLAQCAKPMPFPTSHFVSRLLAMALLLSLVRHVPGFGEQVDYYAVRHRWPTTPADGIYDAERHLTFDPPARVQQMGAFGDQWTGQAQLLWRGAVGARMSARFHVHPGGSHSIVLRLTKASDYGRFHVSLDGGPPLATVDLYDPMVCLAAPVELGEQTLAPGSHTLTFELTGANAQAKPFGQDEYLLGLDCIQVSRTEPAPPSSAQDTNEGVESEVEPFTTAEARGFLQQHCLSCHGVDESHGEIDFREWQQKRHFLERIERTTRMLHVVSNRKMPPEDQRQPTRLARRRLLAYLESLIQEHLRKHPTLSPVAMRRMTRYQYNNSVRDLLRLKGDIFPLPEKTIRAAQVYFEPSRGQLPHAIRVGNRSLGKFQIERQLLQGVTPFAMDLQSEHGFNNRGEELSVSPILLESFLKLATSVVNSPQFESYCTCYADLFTAPEIPATVATEVAVRDAAATRIQRLLERAFRRELDQQLVERYVSLFSTQYIATQSFPDSMKVVVSAVLSSPHFLYLVETKTQASQAEPLSDYELATRLSYFLWNSIPDEALLACARQGNLRDPAVLDRQVQRMLVDPRSQALSQSFARQWLRLDRLITAVPDIDRFPLYYARIGCEQWKFGLQMAIEPLLLFESIVVEDRSLMLLIDSDYTYRSDELQSWYGSATPFGAKDNINRFNTNQQIFKRRRLKDRRQGGVVTTAAVLTMTSTPLRTSPIARGAWVASVVFNSPPAPPPDAVPEIEADETELAAKGLTIRERLRQHQVNQACVSCHADIDPLGFALENYDPIGRWRPSYSSGLPIDTSGKLFGEIEFTDIVSFKDAILSRPEEFFRAFSEHLLSYALGRELRLTDRPAVDRIVRRVTEERGRFSTLISEITRSYPFQHKLNLTQSATADRSEVEHGETNDP